MIDLRRAEVRKGQRENGNRFIEVSDAKNKSESVKVSFDSELQYRKWGLVFVESNKSDE